MREGFGWLVLTVVLGCGGQRSEPAPPPTAPLASPIPAPSLNAAPTPEVLPDDRDLVTDGGDSLTAPARFTLTRTERSIALQAPEHDFRMDLTDVEANDGSEAVRAAFERTEPGMRRAVESTKRYPGRNGWDERVDVIYATSPNEKLVVQASARRRDRTWVVLTQIGSKATADRRRAAVNLVAWSLKRKGYEHETFAGKTARTFDAARISEVTTFVEEARKRADVPGVAFSLVQGDKVVFEGGFGVRELGKPARVDADTLFVIASNTKALTTLLLATLVDEGKFTWETPVTSVYPSFALGNAETTRSVLMKHLVCACTGLPRKDAKMLFEFGNATALDTFRALAETQPTTGFGEAYQYSNPMASAAGYIAGHVIEPSRELGAAYDAAMKARVFEPLGMQHTTFDLRRALRDNHASPHSQDFAEKTIVGPSDMLPGTIPVRPTGGAWSSARDLMKYVQLELRKGMLPSGKRLVSEANILERRKKQVAMSVDRYYGMGLRVRTDWGIPVVFHGGSWLGFQTQMFFLPEHDIGGVILTNSDRGYPIRDPIIRRIIEVAFDGKPEAREDLEIGIEEYQVYVDKERVGLVLPPDPAAVAALAALYRDPILGDLKVKKTKDGVSFDFGEWSSPMATRKEPDGTTSFCAAGNGMLGFDFLVASADGRRTLVHREQQHEYRFVEVN